jgi:cyclin H
MNEDGLYRASTQYRLWSFTPEKLASLRASTNTVATASVKAAIKRKRATKTAASSTTASAAVSDADGSGTPVKNGSGNADSSAAEKPIDCLTAEEEKKLVDFYCSNMLKMGTQKPLELPIQVVVCHRYRLYC